MAGGDTTGYEFAIAARGAKVDGGAAHLEVADGRAGDGLNDN